MALAVGGICADLCGDSGIVEIVPISGVSLGGELWTNWCVESVRICVVILVVHKKSRFLESVQKC